MKAMSRRRFLAAAAASGGVALMPAALRDMARAATASSTTSPEAFYFFDAGQAACAAALCAQIVPSVNPLTGAPAPGAAEARAVVFIDRFLSAFDLPASVADNPAIYLRGPWSNRNAYPDYAIGGPSSEHPPDSFMSPDGQVHYVHLDAIQELAWRILIEGLEKALSTAPAWLSEKWLAQVKSTVIPAPPAEGLQQIYVAGLAAFDSYSQTLFKVPFAGATPQEQTLMLEMAGNVVLSPVPLPPPIGAPAAAKTLFPYVVSHTFEGSYGLPEYRGADTNPLWAEIGWDGDTQPLGSSVYDENLFGPGEGPNAGFGEVGVFVPRGGYKEHRPVSFLGSGGRELSEKDIEQVIEGWTRLGVFGGAP
jgi:Gluconate 2-dehydrogenase subunit 3